ncbi:DUF456 domain-containing protein [Symmachiella dynata]|uniref:DUF456 domain-containing protein n=1 Tax=Symmachiella dynata TaxID=2527995 RepID=UPI0030EC848F
MSYFSPSPEVIYYTWAVLLILASIGAWLLTLFTMPGNWLIVALAAAFAWFYHSPAVHGLSWWVVLGLVVLAGLGEFVEFVAGAAGAAKEGGSRRGMILAIAGAAIGSIAGAIVGVPIPVVGSIVAALGGGAAGAFCGAYLGESWKGVKNHSETLAVSKAALIGRILGTVGKLIVGAAMVAVVSIDALF